MSQIEKILEKFYRKPVPRDITLDDVALIAKHFGCIVDSGGRHQIKIVHKEKGLIMPLPCHGKHIKEIYVKVLKEFFDKLQ